MEKIFYYYLNYTNNNRIISKTIECSWQNFLLNKLKSKIEGSEQVIYLILNYTTVDHFGYYY
jgi:hypothetical protein